MTGRLNEIGRARAQHGAWPAPVTAVIVSSHLAIPASFSRPVLPLPCRSWRWPRPQRAACWWSCPSCSCCRCAVRWPCAPCRPMASRPTPFQLPLARSWLRPACQPGSPAPHHGQAQRPGRPLLQPLQLLGTPALPSDAPSPMELESPMEFLQQALPERQEDPKRSPRHLAPRYPTGQGGAGGGWEKGRGLGPSSVPSIPGGGRGSCAGHLR